MVAVGRLSSPTLEMISMRAGKSSSLYRYDHLHTQKVQVIPKELADVVTTWNTMLKMIEVTQVY